jgi:DNA modification methylase
MNFDLRHGDCLQVLATFPDACVDAIVTDPPYGLAFMGKRWDYDVPSVEIWAECLRVLKPGGHLLAFAGTRTQHRMAVRIEDAGFEIRDMIAWVYGTGFNKVGYIKDDVGNHVLPGFGGSLKPALEPITMARKPFKGNVAANVLAHGTGAINVDGCRVGTAGRWPSNLIHDGSDEVTQLFPDSNSSATPRNRKPRQDRTQWRNGGAQYNNTTEYGDTGSAARFFYTPKASAAERQGVTHPTVKPLDLMAYLCRLITPPNGTILDPFMGSGTTIKAAMSEGFKAIGIERDPDYFAMAQQRLNETQLGFQLL